MKKISTDVYILTEGGTSSGFGHIARCYALCQAFRQIGKKTTLVVDGDNSISRIIKDDDYEAFDWLTMVDEFLITTNTDETIFIVDSYLLDHEGLSYLSSRCKKIAYLDDHGRTDYPPGLILVPINFMQYLNIPYSLDRDMLIGKKYILIREPFWFNRSNRQVTENIERVLIMMGGMDVRGLSQQVLEMISSSFPSAKIELIYNKSIPSLGDIGEKLEGRLIIHSGLGAYEMCELMLSADLAIITAGQAAYELLSLGIPTIQVSIAENQIWALHAIKDAGYTKKIIDINADGFEEDLISSLRVAADMNERKNMRQIGWKEVDGKGALRLARDITQYFN